MPRWEFKEGGSLAKSLPSLSSRPDISNNYGPRVYQDNEQPEWDRTLKAHGMSLSDLTAEQVKVDTRGTIFSYTLVTGEVVHGLPYSITDERIGATAFFDVEVKIKRTDVHSVLGN